ncbi:hypothetical protein Tco_0254332, partial [Tanacetum coccineum]
GYHAYATGKKTPKPKKKKADSELSPKEKHAPASKGKRLKTSSKAAQSTKEKLTCYKDDMNIDELHKFSDVTLNHVRTALNDIATRIQMEYLPKRRWTNQDKRRARVMINVIDRKLRDRRLMRSLEKFVGERPYGEDFWLLQRTI